MKKSIIAIALVASVVSMLSSCVVREGYGPRYGYHHRGYYRGW